jgi:hypothetical protein
MCTTDTINMYSVIELVDFIVEQCFQENGSWCLYCFLGMGWIS